MNSRIYSYEQLLQLGLTETLHQGFKKSALFLWFLYIGNWGELRAQPLSTQTQGGIPGPPSLPQPPHPLLGKLQGALGHISGFQEQGNKHVISPSTPASYTHPSWEGLEETGCHHAFPSSCQVLWLFLHFLETMSPTTHHPPLLPTTWQVTLSFLSGDWINDLPHSRSFCFTASQEQDRKVALF